MDVAGLYRRGALLADGWSDDELRRERRARRLFPVRRGAYVEASDHRLDDGAARHLLVVAAALEKAVAGTVASHVSAAVLHGLPVWGLALARVTVTRTCSGGGRIRSDVHRRVAPLDDDEVVIRHGRPTTSIARTVVDIARTASFEQAVCAADAALARLGPNGEPLVPAARLEEALTRARGRPGVRAATRAVAFADGRSASVGESRSRVALHRHALPAPELQWPVPLRGGRLAVTDFAWPGARVVGEFDGMAKYGRLLQPGRSAAEPSSPRRSARTRCARRG